jgi:hypothetical protein
MTFFEGPAAEKHGATAASSSPSDPKVSNHGLPHTPGESYAIPTFDDHLNAPVPAERI